MTHQQFLKKVSSLRPHVEKLGIRQDCTDYKTLYDQTLSRLAVKQAWLILNKHANIKYWFLKCALNTLKGLEKRAGIYRMRPLPNNLQYDPTNEIHASIDAKTMMSVLSIEDQTLLYDHYCKGVTAKEMADEIMVPENTMKLRIYRAKTRLRTLNCI